MDVTQDHQRPDVTHLAHDIQDRAHILVKASSDHVAWDASMKTAPTRERPVQIWVDADGSTHTMTIDRAYLAIHWRIIRSLILDLADCGNEGKQVLRQLAVAKPSESPG